MLTDHLFGQADPLRRMSIKQEGQEHETHGWGKYQFDGQMRTLTTESPVVIQLQALIRIPRTLPVHWLPTEQPDVITKPLEGDECEQLGWENEALEECRKIVKEIKQIRTDDEAKTPKYTGKMYIFWHFMKTNRRLEPSHATRLDDFTFKKCIKWRQGEGIECTGDTKAPRPEKWKNELLAKYLQIYDPKEKTNLQQKMVSMYKLKTEADDVSNPDDDITRTCYYINLDKKECVEMWNRNRDRESFREEIEVRKTLWQNYSEVFQNSIRHQYIKHNGPWPILLGKPLPQ